MGENLYNKAHKASTPAYRKGYDATFRKEKTMEDMSKHGNQYGKQVVAILDSLLPTEEWRLTWSDGDGNYIYDMEREHLLAQPNIQAAQDYIRGKEGV